MSEEHLGELTEAEDGKDRMGSIKAIVGKGVKSGIQEKKPLFPAPGK